MRNFRAVATVFPPLSVAHVDFELEFSAFAKVLVARVTQWQFARAIPSSTQSGRRPVNVLIVAPSAKKRSCESRARHSSEAELDVDNLAECQ